MSRRKPTPKVKEQVARRAEYRCEYCQALRSYSPSPFDTEHIQPYSLGGLSILENLAYSCHGCNSYKSNRVNCIDPITDISVPLFNPRADDWQTHFSWSDDTRLIIGITPTGRATVECLNLNREELVNLRELLKLVGKHPPI